MKSPFVFAIFALNSVTAQATILRKNNLHLLDGIIESSDMTEADFNRAIARVSARYTPVVAALGGTLVFNPNWNDSTVNASANRSWARSSASLMHCLFGFPRRASSALLIRSADVGKLSSYRLRVEAPKQMDQERF